MTSITKLSLEQQHLKTFTYSYEPFLLLEACNQILNYDAFQTCLNEWKRSSSKIHVCVADNDEFYGDTRRQSTAEVELASFVRHFAAARTSDAAENSYLDSGLRLYLMQSCFLGQTCSNDNNLNCSLSELDQYVHCPQFLKAPHIESCSEKTQTTEIPLPVIKKACVWMSPSRTVTTLHYDEHDNLLCVRTGKKYVLLLPPNAKLMRSSQSDFSDELENDNFGIKSSASNNRFDNEDLSYDPTSDNANNGVHVMQPIFSDFPHHANEAAVKAASEIIRRYATDLVPDDNIAESILPQCKLVTIAAENALFIPKGWFHTVISHPGTFALNFWFECDRPVSIHTSLRTGYRSIIPIKHQIDAWEHYQFRVLALRQLQREVSLILEQHRTQAYEMLSMKRAEADIKVSRWNPYINVDTTSISWNNATFQKLWDLLRFNLNDAVDILAESSKDSGYFPGCAHLNPIQSLIQDLVNDFAGLSSNRFRNFRELDVLLSALDIASANLLLAVILTNSSNTIADATFSCSKWILDVMNGIHGLTLFELSNAWEKGNVNLHNDCTLDAKIQTDIFSVIYSKLSTRRECDLFASLIDTSRQKVMRHTLKRVLAKSGIS